MRVLAVGNMYPPHHLGGYEVTWQGVMRHLRAAGHSARVLTTDFRRPEVADPDEPDTHRELRWYWRDHAWPRFTWRQRLALERHNARSLARHLADFAPDVVSWWAMGGMSLSLLERVRRAKLPAVALIADDWLLYGPTEDKWLRPFRRLPLRGPAAALAGRITGVPARVSLDACARHLFISETLRRSARESGLRVPGSALAHPGIDPARFRAAPEGEWGGRLLYAGRIDLRKGVEDAVASLALLSAEATLTLDGPGGPAELARLREQIGALGLERRVTLAAPSRREALPGVYARADAVLFPVRWSEPWGLVPLEAMAVGRPVVATGLGGSGEYLRDGENCLIARPGDPAAIAAAVAALAADPELRARLREGGFATARRFTQAGFDSAVQAALARAAGA